MSTKVSLLRTVVVVGTQYYYVDKRAVIGHTHCTAHNFCSVSIKINKQISCPVEGGARITGVRIKELFFLCAKGQSRPFS